MGLVSETEIGSKLADVPGWSVVDAKLHRELEFTNFSQAFAFMTRVALIAEKLDHHPDWSNSWNKVTIDVVDHSAGGIADLCFDFASRVNAVLDGK